MQNKSGQLFLGMSVVFHITGVRISQCDYLHIEKGIHFRTPTCLGHTEAQLVEALRCKPEGRGFDSDGVIGIFHFSGRTMALGLNQPLTEMSTRNISWGGEGGKGGRCLGLTMLPPSYADCREIWKPQRPGNLRASPGLQWDYFTFFLTQRCLVQVVECVVK